MSARICNGSSTGALSSKAAAPSESSSSPRKPARVPASAFTPPTLSAHPLPGLGRRGVAPTYLHGSRRVLQHTRHRRPDSRDDSNDKPHPGDGVQDAPLRGAVALERVGDGHRVFAGELGCRGGRGGDLVEVGDEVDEAVDDGLSVSSLLWGERGTAGSYHPRPAAEEHQRGV